MNAVTVKGRPRGAVKPPVAVNRGSELEESFLAVLRLYRLPEPEREVLYAPPRKVRCDFLFRQAGLIVEMEGGVWSRGKTGHNSGSGIENDCERSRLASLHGYRVFRVTRKALDEKPAELMEQIGAILSMWPAPDVCLTPADTDRLTVHVRQTGLTRPQIVTLAVITMLDRADRAAAEGAGHPSYSGPNGDGE